MGKAISENQSGHRKRRGIKWLMPVSALVAVYAKIKAARPSKVRSKSSINSWDTSKKGTSFTEEDTIAEEEQEKYQNMEEGEGLWQRSILMGGKCDPLNFSGVIYYDEKGKKINQLPPRSPRSSPFPTYRSRAQA